MIEWNLDQQIIEKSIYVEFRVVLFKLPQRKDEQRVFNAWYLDLASSSDV